MQPAGVINPQEQQLVEKFRSKLGNNFAFPKFCTSKFEEDHMLVRFLRDQDMDLSKALTKLLNTMKWRSENDIDNVLKKPVDPFIKENYAVGFPGTDREGHPIMIQPVNGSELRPVLKANKVKEYDQFVASTYERLMKEIAESNKKRKPGDPPITQYVMVHDASKYPYGQLLNFSAMKASFQFPVTLCNHYPEILHKVYMINAPSSFSGMFTKVMRKFGAGRLADKMAFYSSAEEWKKDLPKFFDPNVLPVSLGGTRRDS